MTSVPTYDPRSGNPRPMDLRSYNLEALDLSHSLDDLLYASFDDRTVWPPDEWMPQAFDQEQILELGKNPGLGIRTLHGRGITGRGVSIAIIEYGPLLTEHQEYANRLRLYDEVNTYAVTALGQGAAAASIAVGETVGVAPGADLYYIGTRAGRIGYGPDFSRYAQAMQRILAINEQLPAAQKIRIISIGTGWSPHHPGAGPLRAAIEEAKAAGIFVAYSDWVGDMQPYEGLGRVPLADPDLFESYGMALGLSGKQPNDERFVGSLWVPLDSRTTASPTGRNEYVFYRHGSWAGSIQHYLAGVYALALQVNPVITPEQFWSLAMETGRTIDLEHNGETVPLGPIIDPVALIDTLRSD